MRKMRDQGEASRVLFKSPSYNQFVGDLEFVRSENLLGELLE